MPGGQWEMGAYRYGFNGKEKENSWSGYDYGARLYDEKIGRFRSLDPLSHSYPFLSSYAYAANSPIKLIDEEGMGPIDPPLFRIPAVNKTKMRNSGINPEKLAFNLVHKSWYGTRYQVKYEGEIKGYIDVRNQSEHSAYDYEKYYAMAQKGVPEAKKWVSEAVVLNYHLGEEGDENFLSTLISGFDVPNYGGTDMESAMALSMLEGVGNVGQAIDVRGSWGKANNGAPKATSESGKKAVGEAKANFGGRTIYVDENLSPTLVDMLGANGFNAKMITKGEQDAVFSRQIIKGNGILLTANSSDIGTASGFKSGTTIINIQKNALTSKPNRVNLIRKIINLAERNKQNPEVLRQGSVQNIR
jgi:RHS repeat-associated protein